MRGRLYVSISLLISVLALPSASFCQQTVLNASATTAVSETAVSETASDAPVATEKPQKLGKPIQLANGYFQLTPPSGWLVKKPATRIVQYEYAVPKVKDDPADGRITIMGAGGSVKANVDRWIGQFSQTDGTATRDRAKITKKELAGQVVHSVDIAGSFADKPRGPFGPSIQREKYRMLGAIVVSKNKGQYFVKMYGPAKTIAAAAPSFHKFIESLEVTAPK